MTMKDYLIYTHSDKFITLKAHNLQDARARAALKNINDVRSVFKVGTRK